MGDTVLNTGTALNCVESGVVPGPTYGIPEAGVASLMSEICVNPDCRLP